MRDSQKKRSLKGKSSKERNFENYVQKSSSKKLANYSRKRKSATGEPRSNNQAAIDTADLGTSGPKADGIAARFPTATVFQKNIIREMVSTYLKEKNPSTLELEPLNFTLQDQTALVVDVNPLLIAVEFALQGRTVLISESTLESLSPTIRTAMLKLGAPAERIAIATPPPIKPVANSVSLSVALTIL